MDRVSVLRGRHGDPLPLFEPLPGVRDGDVVAYEFELPERFEPWPGRTRLERTFVLLDLGVSFANPCWRRPRNHDGSVTEIDANGAGCWYVDLVAVEGVEGLFTFRDLYIDVIVPTGGRHYRMLDLDEFAEAVADGTLAVDVALDALRRWQRFLDRHLHAGRWPGGEWTDFPPASIRALADLPAPLARPVTWNG